MPYEEILGNYKCLLISTFDCKFLLEEPTEVLDLTELNPKLGRLFDSMEIFGEDILGYIELTRDGMKFDLSSLKAALCKYFSVKDDERLIPRLDSLEQRIKDGKIVEPSISKEMRDAFKQYRLKRYISHRAKKKTVLAARKKEFMSKTRRDIRNFKDLLANEEEYKRVEEVFSDKRVGLYMAYKVMLHAKKSESENNVKQLEKALSYLENYLSQNKDLIATNYELSINYMDGRVKKTKTYSINQIVQYVNSKKVRDTQVEDNRSNKFNYSFFECSGTKAREILETCTRRLSRSTTTPDRVQILQRKIALYRALNFTGIKVGLDSFDGYIGFQLENGFIILDKLYDDIREGKIATENAIYIVRDEDFEKITRLTKTQAIDAINLGVINAKRIIHSGLYEERVVSYIKQQGNK